MARIIWINGLISGSLMIATIIIGMVLKSESTVVSGLFGTLVMLVALSVIFFAIKRYRDRALDGVIRFRTALGMGVGMAGVAALAYALGWEAYLAATNYRFIGEFTDGLLSAQQAAGTNATEFAKLQIEIESMKEMYANPFKRFGITLVEIAPLGLVVALASAGLLCFPGVWPARRLADDQTPNQESPSGSESAE